ncbi:MAG TPA: hypothetical protein VFT49_04490 [Candidatus Saccharimonadales bacterium]|nr:hypothetical protein [Candidatus Saccharimonadales bacterium]
MSEYQPYETQIPPEWADLMESQAQPDGAAEVQNLLHQWWLYQGDSRLEDMPSGRTNCVGFTMVGSKELQDRGIEHFIGVANGHATVVVPEINERGRPTLLLRDMLSRRLNQDLLPSVERSETSIGDLGRLIAETGRAQLLVDGRRIAANASGYDFLRNGPDQVLMIHPWLSFGHHSPNQKTKLIMNLLSPEQGREVLMPYGKFIESVRENDTLAASEALLQMAGCYPDTDVRSTLQKESSTAPTTKIVRKLIKNLATAGEFERAQDVTSAFFDSFSGEDTRVEECRADCLRYIGRAMRHSRDPRNWVTDQSRRLIEEARSVYATLADRPRAYKSSVLGKMAVCDTMLSEF